MPATGLPSLEKLKYVHVTGICGTLMAPFAAYLKRRGIEVSGSDQNIYPPMSDVLAAAKVVLCSGYQPENLSVLGRRPDLVVIGNVITPQNAEARAAIEGGYVYTSLPEAMEKLMLAETRNIVVSGTHGKTTTSSLLSHLLSQAGRKPNYFIGGVAVDLPCSFQVESLAKGHPFVLEGDEYDTAFWDKVPKFNHYLPDDVLLTSVEYDHADIYPDFEAVKRAFEGLLTRIRPGGRLTACLDFPAVKELLGRSLTQASVFTYGSSAASGARFTPGQVRTQGEFTRFQVLDQGEVQAEISLRIPGQHNVMNALAAWIEAREFGLTAAEIERGMASFRGVKRRQEVRGEVHQRLVIDDFAHHPTAVRETLKALKAKYPGRRLVAVFEPRSATSRRKVFQKDYAEAFGEAELAFISSPYDQSKISAENQFSSAQLVDDIARLGTRAGLMKTIEEGVEQVASASQAGDLIAVLSNGGFGGFIPKLLKQLESQD